MTRFLLHLLLVFFMTTSIASARVKLVQLDELPDLADFVIEGTVVEYSARWDDRGIMINTHYTIDVQTAILGKAPATIELSFAGGTVGGHTIGVSHTPTLDLGQTYILFCYQNNKYSVPTVGHDQGVFKVIHDAVSKGDFIVDYNGYQIERITNLNKLIRGHLTRIDKNGALVQRQVAESIQKPPIKPIVRDAEGNIIAQDESAAAPRNLRQPSVPVTRAEFIEFIQLQPQRDRGARK